ncbi:hypothetical protein EXIGLDRAFT_689159 [Exidia glandulosa HHB12029]|uniref:Uncharacterized protein n=1 Tax=Exidia glandulosa HHB12029 TaxID=1314781 RepID=A0A166NF89_EXIGL|nr:hypothetical protein EXIGLDRAFT_689159 [Exidia glandulosa HHB12029]
MPFTIQNELKTRDDLAKFLRSLLDPLAQHTSPGGALLTLGATGTHYDERAAQLEGFSRPLWGLGSLLAGGGTYDGVERWVRGFASGSNPDSEEFWGPMRDKDQRMVECSAIGFTLTIAREAIWDPLSDEAKANLEAWLGGMMAKSMPDTNWLWFRVFANLGLSRVGSKHFDAARMAKDLDRLDSYYIADGWSRDGPDGLQLDYYSSSFAIQFAQLVYAKLAANDDPERSKKYKERAARFALDFAHYFDDQGRAIPFGRSSTYRFAQASFWGALAYADVELPAPLTWGAVKGYLLRNLRWWLTQPFLSGDGIVTIGFGYPNHNMTENYNSPGSPYWCCKAFLPLALPADHPFWTSAEEGIPAALPETVALPHPLHIITRAGGHTFLLSSGQMCAYPLRHSAAKYGKLAYSAPFGFCMPVGIGGIEELGGDSTLALSDDEGETYRVRRAVRGAEIQVLESSGTPVLHSFWDAWADTEVETWLVPPTAGSLWHVRVHRVKAGRTLRAAEGAFALHGQGRDHRALPATDPTQGDGAVGEKGLSLAASGAGAVGIVDLVQETRDGVAVRVDANSNLMVPRAVLPTLIGEISAGTEVWYATGVFAVPAQAGKYGAPETWVKAWQTKPEIPQEILQIIKQ